MLLLSNSFAQFWGVGAPYGNVPYGWMSCIGKGPIWVNLPYGWTSRMCERPIWVTTEHPIWVNVLYPIWVIVSYVWMCHICKYPIYLKVPYGWAFLMATCLFTRLESLAWSQQGIWQPRFCRERNLWSLCCDMITKLKFLCIACMGNWESGDKSICHPSKLPYTFPLLQESNSD